ncbi:hypothetical protein VQ056_06275 [Paenibacillus sp. JTLBN-2024]
MRLHSFHPNFILTIFRKTVAWKNHEKSRRCGLLEHAWTKPARSAEGSAYSGSKKSVDNWKTILYDKVIGPHQKLKHFNFCSVLPV